MKFDKPNSVPCEQGGNHLSYYSIATAVKRSTMDNSENRTKRVTSHPVKTGFIQNLILHQIGFVMPLHINYVPYKGILNRTKR